MRQLRLELRNSEFYVRFSVLIEIYFGFSVLHDFLCGFSVSYRPQRPPLEGIDCGVQQHRR